MSRYYVGLTAEARREPFTARTTPTPETHGTRYQAVIGPFRTRRGALFMAQHGQNNPHLQTVADAERVARREARRRPA